jgi:hypothetical protein
LENQKKAYIHALIAVFFWSTVASVFKISLETLSVAQLVFYAVLTSTVVLFTIVVIKNLLKDVVLHFIIRDIKPFFTIYYTF